jgi:signal transduction histidine kinase
MPYRFFLVFLLIGQFISAQSLKDLARKQLNEHDNAVSSTIEKIEKQEGESNDVLYFKAQYLSNIGDFVKSNKVAEKALYANAVSNKLELLRLLMINHYLNGTLDSCIHYGQKLLGLKLPMQEQAKAQVLIANAHWSLGNTNYALEGYEKAIQIGKKINDSSSYSTALNGLGLIFFEVKKENQKALNLFRRAILYTPVDRPLNKANYQVNISGVYIELNQFDSALVNLNESEKTAKIFDDQELQFSCYVNKGVVFLRKGNLKESEYYLRNAEKLAEIGAFKATKVEAVYLALSDLTYKKGDYKLSRDYYNKYFDCYDKRINDEKNKKILLLQEQFNATEKKNIIAELKLEQQNAQLEQQASDTAYFKLWFFLVGLISVIILVGFISYFIYRRKKSKKEHFVALEKRRAVLEAVEKEKYRFSRELHDSLGGTLTMSKLLAGQTNDEEIRPKLEQFLQSAIDDTRRISRDLYPSLLKMGGLKTALEDLFWNLSEVNQSVTFSFTMHEPTGALPDSFSLTIYRICQELTNNTIKYANAEAVSLDIDFDENKLLFRYKDDGVGLDLSTYKMGVGMNSIQERLLTIHGSVQVITSPNNGFEVRIEAIVPNEN